MPTFGNWKPALVNTMSELWKSRCIIRSLCSITLVAILSSTHALAKVWPDKFVTLGLFGPGNNDGLFKILDALPPQPSDKLLVAWPPSDVCSPFTRLNFTL